jgi:hypothetical protein
LRASSIPLSLRPSILTLPPTGAPMSSLHTSSSFCPFHLIHTSAPVAPALSFLLTSFPRPSLCSLAPTSFRPALTRIPPLLRILLRPPLTPLTPHQLPCVSMP